MKKLKLLSICLVLIGIGSLSYYIFGQEHRYAKRYAHQFFDYPLPQKTKVMEKGFDHGVLYGGGPSGSGGYPTVASYMKLSSELSEKEIFDYYHKKQFEIYFEGDATMEKDSKGRIWYEGEDAVKENLSIENNKERPIQFIIQSKKEFSYPFFISF